MDDKNVILIFTSVIILTGCVVGGISSYEYYTSCLEHHEKQSAIYPVTGQVTNVEYLSGDYTSTTKITLNSNEFYVLYGMYEAVIGDNITIFYTGTKYYPSKWIIVVNN